MYIDISYIHICTYMKHYYEAEKEKIGLPYTTSIDLQWPWNEEIIRTGSPCSRGPVLTILRRPDGSRCDPGLHGSGVIQRKCPINGEYFQ